MKPELSEWCTKFHRVLISHRPIKSISAARRVISFCEWRGANVSSAQVFGHFNLHINTEKVDRQSRQCTARDFVCARRD